MPPRLRLLFLLLIVSGAAAGSGIRGGETSAADPQAVRRLVAAIRSPRITAERLAAVVGQLVAAGEPGRSALDEHLARELDRLSAATAGRPNTTALDREIDGLRDALRRLRDQPQLSQEQLQEVGLPALESLTVIWGRREAALGPWRKKQQLAREQSERLAAVVAAWQAAIPEAPVAEHLGRLTDLRAALAPDDAEAASVVAENELIARTLPAEIVPGMTAVNTVRLTCGLAPLLFDPKLCEAAALHSRDMETHGFFTHESPLPGKETPWDRAKLAGTTASGENIFMGSNVGSDAIKAWFLSPGHHKNMFGEGHTRQGLGRAGKHWTQLFGAE